MSTQPDPLETKAPLERPFYATGMLLDAQDFSDEQTYHRGRLAQALLGLHGYGTVAGLEVLHEIDIKQNPVPGGPDIILERLKVRPGLAIDRVGRLIEVPADACLPLGRWYDTSLADESKRGPLIQAFHPPKPDPTVAGNPLVIRGVAPHPDPPFAGDLKPADLLLDGVVVVDLFLRFVCCEEGKTPALACGPFDALDAVQTSRIRDWYELVLVPRAEEDLKTVVPEDVWREAAGQPDAATRRTMIRQATFKAWDRRNRPAPPEYPAGRAGEPGVLLARVALHAKQPAAVGAAPQRPDPPTLKSVLVNNDLRPFVAHAGAVARALGL